MTYECLLYCRKTRKQPLATEKTIRNWNPWKLPKLIMVVAEPLFQHACNSCIRNNSVLPYLSAPRFAPLGTALSEYSWYGNHTSREITMTHTREHALSSFAPQPEVKRLTKSDEELA